MGFNLIHFGFTTHRRVTLYIQWTSHSVCVSLSCLPARVRSGRLRGTAPTTRSTASGPRIWRSISVRCAPHAHTQFFNRLSDVWYPRLAHITPRTVFIPMRESEAAAIKACALPATRSTAQAHRVISKPQVPRLHVACCCKDPFTRVNFRHSSSRCCHRRQHSRQRLAQVELLLCSPAL